MIAPYVLISLALVAYLVLYIWHSGGLSTVLRSRKYKSGTGWCAWRWTDVDSEYILRLHVVKTPWFAVCLHWINKPDAEPWLHDHPVSFLSVILRGGYTETRKRGAGGPIRTERHRWFNFVRASMLDRHRITAVHGKTLTLCFMGPKTREWGFHVWTELSPDGWIGWKDYYARLRAGEDMRRTTTIDKLNEVLKFYYTPTRMAQVAGYAAPAFATLEREIRAIDTRKPAPADDFEAEEVSGG